MVKHEVTDQRHLAVAYGGEFLLVVAIDGPELVRLGDGEFHDLVENADFARVEVRTQHFEIGAGVIGRQVGLPLIRRGATVQEERGGEEC